MEPEIRVDPVDFLRDLYKSDIPYLLVGRHALALLGAPLITADYDFYLSPEIEHLDDLLALAGKLRLECSVKNPRTRPIFSLLCDTAKFDFFRLREYRTQDGESFTFASIFGRKRTLELEDFAVYIPRIEDLIRIKRVRNAPKDREDIKYLQVLLEREND